MQENPSADDHTTSVEVRQNLNTGEVSVIRHMDAVSKYPDKPSAGEQADKLADYRIVVHNDMNAPLEISIQWDDEDGPTSTYWAFDIADAQVLMETFRAYNQSNKRNCQIRWRDWNKIVETTAHPVWVMFPW